MQLLLLEVLLVQLVIAHLEAGDVLEELLDFVLIVLPGGQAGEVVVDARILVDGEVEVVQLFIRDIFLFEASKQILHLSVIVLEVLLDLLEFIGFLLEPLQILPIFDDDFLLTLQLELLDSDVRWSLPARLKQGLVEGLLIRNKSSLIIYLLLVLN
jgi:hypothetical protein